MSTPLGPFYRGQKCQVVNPRILEPNSKATFVPLESDACVIFVPERVGRSLPALWYDSLMAVKHPLEEDLAAVDAAVRHARSVRSFHRRRSIRGSKQREQDLHEARERLKKVMVPLRSFLGKAPYETQSDHHKAFTERVRLASKELQSERRKLWKMMDRKKKA